MFSILQLLNTILTRNIKNKCENSGDTYLEIIYTSFQLTRQFGIHFQILLARSWWYSEWVSSMCLPNCVYHLLIHSTSFWNGAVPNLTGQIHNKLYVVSGQLFRYTSKYQSFCNSWWAVKKSKQKSSEKI